MKKIKVFSYGFFWLMFLGSNTLNGQIINTQKEHTLSLSLQFLQNNDEGNYGRVFTATQLDIGYEYRKRYDSQQIGFKTTAGAAIGTGAGTEFQFNPVQVHYGKKMSLGDDLELYIGPYLGINYRWQLYSTFQGAKNRWYTAFELGPKASLTIPYRERFIQIHLSNSLAGWTSRPQLEPSSYFVNTSFRHFFKNANQNLKLGSFNRFNHTLFEVGLMPLDGKKTYFSYQFEYMGFYDESRFTQLGHALKCTWQLGK